MSLVATVKKIKFVARWYLMYNARLVWLQARLPKDADKVCLVESDVAGLERRRRGAQAEIFDRVLKYGKLCAECGGRCCQEPVDRYTIFDQYIHGGLGRPLENYSGRIYSLPWLLANGFRHAVKRVTGIGKEPPPCRYLSPAGCRLKKEMRPMLCASWFCPKYLRSISPEDMLLLARPLKEIENIHCEIYRSSRNPNGNPPPA